MYFDHFKALFLFLSDCFMVDWREPDVSRERNVFHSGILQHVGLQVLKVM